MRTIPLQTFKKWFSLLLMITVSGCAGMAPPDDLDYRDCSEQGGFSRGYNDGRAGNPMDSKFAAYCGFEKEKTEAGYREGYMSAKGKKSSTKKSAKNESEDGGSSGNSNGGNQTNVNVNVGGIFNKGATQGNGTSSGNGPGSWSGNDSGNGGNSMVGGPKAFYCKAEVFTDVFESFGPTQLEAKKAALDKCVAANNFRSSCERKIKCERNE